MTKLARNPDYSDFDMDFTRHPTTNDVVVKTGEDAIKRSIRNLVFTNFYDRPFRSFIGSNARKMLFENVTPLTANFLRDAIYEVIGNYEPRVLVNHVGIGVSPDRNGYDVVISFIIINRNQPVTVNLFLERIR